MHFTIPPNDSVVWPIVRVAVRAGLLIVALWCFYDKLDPRDVKTVLMMIVADTGLSLSGWSASGK